MECFYGKGTTCSDKTSDEYIFVNNFGYVKNIDQDFTILRKNGRLDYQIIYVDKGYGSFLLNGEYVRADSGSIVILPPGQKNHYEFTSDSSSDFYWIHFTGYGVPQLLKKLNLEESIFSIGDFFEFKEIFANMSKAIIVENFATDPYLSSAIYMILSQVSRKLFIPDNSLRKVLTLMQNGNVNTLSNADYAKMCRLSEYHFIRIFKKFTGVTPHRYMVKVTTNKAMELLTNTNMNISEIATMLGFEDSLYFSRFFKKETGHSPKNYRKKAFE